MEGAPGQVAQQVFRRWDESPDAEFYDTPRMVTHIDDSAIQAVTQLYREYFPPGGALLDLMSSWVSHLPHEVTYRRVVGLGMNADELRANSHLTQWLVQDLNRDPGLPFLDGEFDGAGICVSIQYLIQPARVLREVGRVLHTRTVPHLQFVFDESIAGAIRMQQLLRELGQQRGDRPASGTGDPPGQTPGEDRDGKDQPSP